MAQITDYSAASIKTFRGMEGSGYNAVLVRDGKKVAEIIDAGNGGEIHIHFLDEKAPKVEGKFRLYDDQVKTRMMTPEEAVFYAMVFDLPQYKSEFSDDMCYKNAHIVCDDIVNDVLSARRLTNSLKKNILFVLPKGVYKSPLRDLAAQTAQINTKYPGAQILNNMPFAEALALAIKHHAA